MIANFFNKTKPVNFLVIGILLFVYYSISIFSSGDETYTVSFFTKFLGLFLVLFLFLLLFKFIVEKNKLTKDNSYALLLLVIVLGTFNESISNNYLIYSNLFLLLSYRKLYSLRTGLNTKMKLFDASFWVGIATIFYSWSVIYILLIYVSIVIYRKGSLKNLLIPVVGLATPIFIYFTYNFHFDNLPVFYETFNYNMNFSFVVYKDLKLLIPALFLAVTLLWSLVVVSPNIVSVSNNMKFSWNVLINHLLISTVLIVVSPLKNGSEMFFIAFPSAIIISNFIQNKKSSLFKNVMIYLYLILSVSIYYL
jgi:hypothetical protein